MSLFFSHSAGGFFEEGFHQNMPDDAVAITAAERAALIDGQSRGKTIVADGTGHPVLTSAVDYVPTIGDAQRERDRRIALGTVVTVTGIGPVPVQGRPQDQINLLGLSQRAQLQIAASDATPIRFRDGDNTTHDMTPAQIIEMVTGGAAFIEAVHQVVWSWADGGPVPADFTDDTHWP